MQKNTLGIIAAAAIALGAAGFATSANASIASAGRTAPAATADKNVELARHYYRRYYRIRNCRWVRRTYYNYYTGYTYVRWVKYCTPYRYYYTY